MMNFSGNVEINISNANQSTPLLRLVSLSALSVVNVVGIIVNIIIVVVLTKTKRFQPVPRVILINTSVTDFLTGVFILLFCVPVYLCNIHTSTDDVKLVLTTIILTLYSVSSHSMTCHALVLYVAVCHSLKYAGFITVRKIVLILVLIWIWNTGLSCLHFIQRRFYTVDNTSDMVKVTYDAQSWWFGFVVLLNSTVLPVIVSTFCDCRIKKHGLFLSQSTWSGFGRSLWMMASIRLNFVCFVFSILSWTIIHIAQVLRLPKGWTALATLMVFIFQIMKIWAYLYIYPPFRETVRSRLGCFQHHTPVSGAGNPMIDIAWPATRQTEIH